MLLSHPNPIHLTYCTNIHPANGWKAVFENLQAYALPLKKQFAPDTPFGLGLRLSHKESQTLQQKENLRDFQVWLQESGLYVFTLNGFPYGPFHRQAVKAKVHEPDWLTYERFSYTQRLIDILTHVLPPGVEGGISTSPLSYKPWIDRNDDATWQRFTTQLIELTAHMVHIYQEHGKLIHIDIEPEPDGVLETSTEAVTFFEEWLLQRGSLQLANLLGCSKERACECILRHLRLCYDTCHVAVVYEAPSEVMQRYQNAGISVGKVQISSALKIDFSATQAPATQIEALLPFAESTYLHQVVQRNLDGTFKQYPDLPEAIEQFDSKVAAEWRIHFHVPIFLDSFASFDSTQDGILSLFELAQTMPTSQHFEIETYTWEVLPPALKRPLNESIAREYEWVLQHLRM